MLIILNSIVNHWTCSVSILFMCVIPGGSVTWVFGFDFFGADVMGGDLEQRNKYEIKDDTCLNTYKASPSLENSVSPDDASSV